MSPCPDHRVPADEQPSPVPGLSRLPEDFAHAVELLQAGQVVAFPTDTVYGVGAVAWNGGAVARLYRVKGRPDNKAIPILLADPADLLRVAAANLPVAAAQLAIRFWPGPLTMVLPKAPGIPDEVTLGGATIAVRVPAHDLARALIRAAGGALATTSANLSGQPSAVRASEVAAQLDGRIPLILDGGPCPGGIPSTLVDLTGPAPLILRAGPISLEEILGSAC